MRRALLALALLALVLAPAGAADVSLDRHFLSGGTREGDWSCYEVTTTVDDPDPAKPAQKQTFHVTYRVQSIHEDVCDFQVETDPPRPHSWETTAIHRGSSSVRELLGIGDAVALVAEGHRDDAQTLVDAKGNERTLRCTCYEFTTTEGSIVQKNELWLDTAHDDHHGFRFVALTTHAAPGARGATVAMVAKGWGRRDFTEWGADLVKKAK